VRLAPKLARDGIKVKGVRLDSGDLADHAFKVRKILDSGGLKEATIFASGSVDEYLLARLQAQRAPIDGYGIGTHMDTSADAPYLDCAYKLVEYAGTARRKRSEGKVLWPGRKQIFRRYDGDGRMIGDVLTLAGDQLEGEALIQPVMRAGRRIAPAVPLDESRARALDELSRLPEPLRQLTQAPPYRVRVSEAVERLAQAVDAKQLKSGEAQLSVSETPSQQSSAG
jgi:nicotinate phosphoribosyltransferase